MNFVNTESKAGARLLHSYLCMFASHTKQYEMGRTGFQGRILKGEGLPLQLAGQSHERMPTPML